MEFLSFDSVPSGSNDSDSNQAANDVIDPRDHVSGAAYANENRVTMDSSGCISHSLHRLERVCSTGEKHQNELYEKQLKKALKNREQAQKCSFFNKRLPDLQRVWAPKHLGKVNTRPITKHDRKKHARETADVVYETPALATRKSRRLHASRGGEHEETSSFRSVSKVLFPSFESIEISSQSGCKK